VSYYSDWNNLVFFFGNKAYISLPLRDISVIHFGRKNHEKEKENNGESINETKCCWVGERINEG